MTTIYEMLQILNEYDNSGNLMTLAIRGGQKAKGKNLDNILTGKTSPYKTEERKPTKNQLNYPNLNKLIQQIKNQQNSIGGGKVVTGQALKELQSMLSTKRMKKDENGNVILPFGNDMRLKEVNGGFVIDYQNKNTAQTSDAEKIDSEIADIPL